MLAINRTTFVTVQPGAIAAECDEIADGSVSVVPHYDYIICRRARKKLATAVLVLGSTAGAGWARPLPQAVLTCATRRALGPPATAGGSDLRGGGRPLPQAVLTIPCACRLLRPRSPQNLVAHKVGGRRC